MKNQEKIFVIGHKNPDTDSICSAIAYCDIKNRTTQESRYIPKRAGQINEETEYVLNRFGVHPPGYLSNIGTQVKDMDIRVQKGKITSIIGPNGSGKSTLASVLAGNEKFTVTEGSATFLGQDLLDMPIEDRARLGLFLGFQYPVEIPGVTMANFMKLAVNEQRKFRGEEPLTAAEFLRLMREKSAVVELDAKLTSRAVNEGFSGGEKKKNEIFQMAMLDPKLAILDETDSGLDIDALRIVATGVTKLHTPQNATVVITHYQRLLDYIVPDVVHVLYKGRIIHTGDKTLALKLEKEGYDWLINDYRE